MLISKKNNFSNIKLLDKVGYVSKLPQTTTDLLSNIIIINDSMAFNPNSKTAPNTALKWAKDFTSKITPQPYETENRPLSLKIINLDIRGEGGRAYKVIDDKNRQFDLREDQLLESIALCGIGKGGQILGTFVWATLGSQIRLILVGGKLHKMAIL